MLLAALEYVHNYHADDVDTSHYTVPQLEFVRQLSDSPENVVFALVRSQSSAESLRGLGKKNVHVLEADITDFAALKVHRRRMDLLPTVH